MARHREFDTEVALTAAMDTFWERGYDGTSVRDLEQAMQLQKGSIYQAFGDKYTLYSMAFEFFLDDLHRIVSKDLQETKNPVEAIRECLGSLVRKSMRPVAKKGLFTTNALVERGPFDQNIVKSVKEFNRKLAKLLETRIEEGQKSGVFRQDISASDLSSMVTVYVTGISSQSRGLSTRPELNQQVDLVIAMLSK